MFRDGHTRSVAAVRGLRRTRLAGESTRSAVAQNRSPAGRSVPAAGSMTRCNPLFQLDDREPLFLLDLAGFFIFRARFHETSPAGYEVAWFATGVSECTRRSYR